MFLAFWGPLGMCFQPCNACPNLKNLTTPKPQSAIKGDFFYCPGRLPTVCHNTSGTQSAIFRPSKGQTFFLRKFSDKLYFRKKKISTPFLWKVFQNMPTPASGPSKTNPGHQIAHKGGHFVSVQWVLTVFWIQKCVYALSGPLQNYSIWNFSMPPPIQFNMVPKCNKSWWLSWHKRWAL